MQLISLISQTPCLWAFFSDISDIGWRFGGCIDEKTLRFLSNNTGLYELGGTYR
mgnify:CR=1 FL=1